VNNAPNWTNTLAPMRKPSLSFWFLLAIAASSTWVVARAFAVGHKTNFETLASVLATVGATLLGFILTAVTILAALADTKLVSNMSKTGHSRVLLDELFGSVAIFFIVTALAMASLFGPDASALWCAALASMYFILGAGTLVVAGKKFYTVMLVMDKSQG
jgi:hypothetical protein